MLSDLWTQIGVVATVVGAVCALIDKGTALRSWWHGETGKWPPSPSSPGSSGPLLSPGTSTNAGDPAIVAGLRLRYSGSEQAELEEQPWARHDEEEANIGL